MSIHASQPNSASSYSLTLQDTHAIEAALIQDLLANPIKGLKRIDAAILISEGRYFYQRRVSSSPVRYSYKCLSPDILSLAFNNQPSDTGWISAGIVRCGMSIKGSWAVQFVPPGRHTIQLQGIGVATVPLPGLIWIGLEQNYWLFAVADKMFDPETQCFHAPLPNVYENGSVCWGTNTPPIANSQSIVQAWQLFISSPFNNHLTTYKSRLHSSDITRQLAQLHEKAGKRYPTRDLLPLNRKTTVNQLVQRLLLDNDSEK